MGAPRCPPIRPRDLAGLGLPRTAQETPRADGRISRLSDGADAEALGSRAAQRLTVLARVENKESPSQESTAAAGAKELQESLEKEAEKHAQKHTMSRSR